MSLEDNIVAVKLRMQRTIQSIQQKIGDNADFLNGLASINQDMLERCKRLPGCTAEVRTLLNQEYKLMNFSFQLVRRQLVKALIDDQQDLASHILDEMLDDRGLIYGHSYHDHILAKLLFWIMLHTPIQHRQIMAESAMVQAIQRGICEGFANTRVNRILNNQSFDQPLQELLKLSGEQLLNMFHSPQSAEVPMLLDEILYRQTKYHASDWELALSHATLPKYIEELSDEHLELIQQMDSHFNDVITEKFVPRILSRASRVTPNLVIFLENYSRQQLVDFFTLNGSKGLFFPEGQYQIAANDHVINIEVKNNQLHAIDVNQYINNPLSSQAEELIEQLSQPYRLFDEQGEHYALIHYYQPAHSNGSEYNKKVYTTFSNALSDWCRETKDVVSPVEIQRYLFYRMLSYDMPQPEACQDIAQKLYTPQSQQLIHAYKVSVKKHERLQHWHTREQCLLNPPQNDLSHHHQTLIGLYSFIWTCFAVLLYMIKLKTHRPAKQNHLLPRDSAKKPSPSPTAMS